jgi:hypothetical protein
VTFDMAMRLHWSSKYITLAVSGSREQAGYVHHVYSTRIMVLSACWDYSKKLSRACTFLAAILSLLNVFIHGHSY